MGLRVDDRKLVRLRLVLRVVEEEDRPLLLVEMPFDRRVVRGVLVVGELGRAFASFRCGEQGSRLKLSSVEVSRLFLIVAGEIQDWLVAPQR